MDNVDLKDKLTGLRGLYDEQPVAKTVFDWAAGRKREAAETNIERIVQLTRITNAEAVKLSREIEALECGRFVIGRRGAKSRIRWKYSLRSLGEAARGMTDTLEEIEPETGTGIGTDGSDHRPPTPVVHADTGATLTIREAKKRLAITFGVPPDAIEITIRG